MFNREWIEKQNYIIIVCLYVKRFKRVILNILKDFSFIKYPITSAKHEWDTNMTWKWSNVQCKTYL